MLSASDEYRSDASLLILQDVLRQRGIASTISHGSEYGQRFDDDLSDMESADVLLIFTRRMDLVADQLKRIQNWCLKGKPVIGIRTASHAFQNWLEFDHAILGGDYCNHSGDEQNVQYRLAAFGHQILAGVQGWDGPGRIYRNPQLASDATVLLTAHSAEGLQPVAWCRLHPKTKGRVFYTSLGSLYDFANSQFIRLVENAILWTADQLVKPISQPRYWVSQLDQMDGVQCPCGISRRAFVRPDNPLATLHMVDIRVNAEKHYHKKLTEIYLILEGEGFMELDDDRIPVQPLTAIFIPPGVRHRAVGQMRIVNLPVPAFDPTDEWFDK